MPVYKDKKNGKWYVSYTFKDLPTNTFKKRVKRGFETKKAAEKWERENYSSTSEERSEEQPVFDKTFKDVASEWEDLSESSDVSRTRHIEHFKYRLSNIFTNKAVNKITKADLVEWRAKLGSTDYATNTKNATISFVKSVLTYTSMMYGFKNEGLILKAFRKTNEELLRERPTWTPEEFNLFLDKVSDDYKLFFEFLFWTGCRRGEAIALQKKDILGANCYIQYSQRTQKAGLRPTKTKTTRWITMDDNLSQKINTHLEDNDGSYVFGGSKGLSCSPIDDEFKKAIEESGVKKIRLHDLRHSHATWLINNGVNIVAISKRLGHATIEQTLNTYSHLLQSTDTDMMNTINSLKK